MKVTNLPRRMLVRVGRESIGEWLVVGQDVECAAFNEMPEVLDSEIDSQKLSIKHTVSCFGWLKLL